MGFSLSRALQGATMGAAHAAGEVFDDMIKEERKQREAVEAQARAKELATFQADLIVDRERSRDELKDAREKKDREGLSTQMKEVRAAVRDAGLDPDKYDGMKMAAGLADEKGYTSIADKWRARMETERSHMANEENKRLQIAGLHEARAARKRGESEADYEKSMRRIDREVAGFLVPSPTDDNPRATDAGAAVAVKNYALNRLDSGDNIKNIVADINRFRADFLAQPPSDSQKMSPTARAESIIKFHQLPEEEKVKLRAKKTGLPGDAGSLPPDGTKKADTGGGLWGAIKGTFGQAGQNMQGTADALSVGNGD